VKFIIASKEKEMSKEYAFHRMEVLKKMIANKNFVVIDGGTGTEIERLGGEMDEKGLRSININTCLMFKLLLYTGWSCVAQLMIPEIVKQVHINYIKAGASIITV
jgi:S-methylmethionine-dependent homocysteine/selenocysteine methylase